MGSLKVHTTLKINQFNLIIAGAPKPSGPNTFTMVWPLGSKWRRGACPPGKRLRWRLEAEFRRRRRSRLHPWPEAAAAKRRCWFREHPRIAGLDNQHITAGLREYTSAAQCSRSARPRPKRSDHRGRWEGDSKMLHCRTRRCTGKSAVRSWSRWLSESRLLEYQALRRLGRPERLQRLQCK